MTPTAIKAAQRAAALGGVLRAQAKLLGELKDLAGEFVELDAFEAIEATAGPVDKALGALRKVATQSSGNPAVFAELLHKSDADLARLTLWASGRAHAVLLGLVEELAAQDEDAEAEDADT